MAYLNKLKFFPQNSFFFPLFLRIDCQNCEQLDLLWLVNVDALVIVRGACNAMSMHFTHHRDHAENVRLAHAR